MDATSCCGLFLSLVLSIPPLGDTPTEAVCGPGRDWDDNGYIMFCPCMGRFGNQMEQYLGVLALAKAVNRTLVLPPFKSSNKFVQPYDYVAPVSDWFRVDVLTKFHRVITMKDFLTNFGTQKWPPGKRWGYCKDLPEWPECDVRRPGSEWLWGGLNIDIDGHVVFDASLNADISDEPGMTRLRYQWNDRYPASDHPVIVFGDAPGRFPMNPGNRQIQKYFEWNPKFFTTAADEMSRMFHGEKFVGIHLRTGEDWGRACNRNVPARQIMASPQCLPPSSGKVISRNMCYPTVAHVVKLTTKAVEKYEARHVYIATDKLTYIDQLMAAMSQHKVKVHFLNPDIPQMDLMILGKADFFIGNCVSSFTSFVKRDRDGKNMPSTFWGFPVSFRARGPK